MARDRTRARRVAWVVVITAFVVLALVAGLAIWYADDARRWWAGPEATPTPDPVTAPELVLPPPGVTLPPVPDPVPVAPPARSGALDPTRVRLAVAPGLLDRRLGRHVVAAVAPLAAGAPVFESGSGSFIPASTTKLLTAVAALETLGPDHTFRTRVLRVGRSNQVVLVGGGDPYLASRPLAGAAAATTYPPRGDVATLARRTATALRGEGVSAVRVGYDASLFTGPVGSPQWEPDYLPDDVVAPITALWVDGARSPTGFGRVDDPPAVAAAAFAAGLRRAGVRVLDSPSPQQAAGGSREVASVESAPLSQIVEHVLDVSDNEAAEVLGHHVGLATGGAGSFASGARGTLDTLRALGIPTAGVRLYDGSGLSRQNRLTASLLLRLMRVAGNPEHPALRAAVTGLPVAGFTGSLAYRFDQGPPAGRGRVRAKTGTLTGVHGLAGVAVDRQGNLMAFVLVADRVRDRNALTARTTLDEVAGELGACRCAA